MEDTTDAAANSGRVVVIFGGRSEIGAELAIRLATAATVVLAAPIGAPDTVAGLREVADDVVCMATPRGFSAVGQGYDDFSQTSDEEVCALLRAARREGRTARPPETGQ